MAPLAQLTLSNPRAWPKPLRLLPAASVAPIDVNLREALEERYLAYALSTIMGRALPDARDGLKPVHRRILYGMHILRLDPGSAFKKCAKIVGDVMGSFHPHGDQAIYDALVRLAQDFSSRYPLVEGQGNFGNIDGDSAAAYRYTEARMTDVARLLLEGIDEDSIDLRDNYSGDTKEPIVLPAALPNLLANGAQGIAVGMATSIPPHNVAELCDAALYLIAHPEADVARPCCIRPGPGLSDRRRCHRHTGGDRRNLPHRTRRVPRARPLDEGGGRARAAGSSSSPKSPMACRSRGSSSSIANLLNEKKLPLLADVRDESTEDVRIVLEPRSPHGRAGDPDGIVVPAVRARDARPDEHECARRRRHRRASSASPRRCSNGSTIAATCCCAAPATASRRSSSRLEMLAGMMVVFLNLDEVIRIIREEDEPKEALKARFAPDRAAGRLLLDTRLPRLRRLEEMELKRSRTSSGRRRPRSRTLLGAERKQWQTISYEVRDMRRNTGPTRRSADGAPLSRRRLTSSSSISTRP